MVQPHVRGEYISSRSRTPGYRGSAPRAWGILEDVEKWKSLWRFNPTCVGNTT